MDKPADLLALSLAVQIPLDGGYIAYFIAYADVRQHPSATDLVFKIVASGLVASDVLAWTPFIDPIRSPMAIAAA